MKTPAVAIVFLITDTQTHWCVLENVVRPFPVLLKYLVSFFFFFQMIHISGEQNKVTDGENGFRHHGNQKTAADWPVESIELRAMM